MISLKIIFLTLAGLYIIGCSVLFALMRQNQTVRELPSTSSITDYLFLDTIETSNDPTDESPTEPAQYNFTDPALAYKVLSKLDVHKPVIESQLPDKNRESEAYLGLKGDDNYCNKHRAYFVEYPESVFEQINIIHDWERGTFVTGIITSIANDLHTKNTRRMGRKQRAIPTHEVMPNANIFFTTPALSYYLSLHTQFSCLSQLSNHIPGSYKLSLKHHIAQATATYVTKYEDRPHCLAYDKFFPQTWLLSDKAECLEFFDKLNSPEYKQLQEERNIVYIKKLSNTHRGKGVQPLHLEEEVKLREEYKNGARCGKIKTKLLMQHYIHNPLLLNGHKFDFRMYLLVASVNPLIAYYHDGFLRVSLVEYDTTSTDKKALLTNLSLNKQIYEDAQNGNLFGGMDKEALKNAQQWSFDRLHTYLLENKIISDENWLDNHLRPEFKKALIHLIRMTSDNFLSHSSFYGLYGVDFMLDTNLNLWFIEANSGPAFDGYSQPMEVFITKMLKDHFEVVVGLLRSRMKRAVNYVNKLIKEGGVQEDANGEVVIQELEKNMQVFNDITKNYFEKEFEISESNGFAKIIDGNYEGAKMYQGLLKEECL